LPELSWKEKARAHLGGMGDTEIKQGDLVDTYARSSFEDTSAQGPQVRRDGSTIRATKPRRSAEAAGERPRHPRALARHSFSR
jgi:hypothetical protein